MKISISNLLTLSIEIAHQYRPLFICVRKIIINEVSIVGAEFLEKIELNFYELIEVMRRGEQT